MLDDSSHRYAQNRKTVYLRSFPRDIYSYKFSHLKAMCLAGNSTIICSIMNLPFQITMEDKLCHLTILLLYLLLYLLVTLLYFIRYRKMNLSQIAL